MIKQLQFLDDTSDKFWHIEVHGLSHTVSFGRNGSAGQQKTKTFESAEACLADAEKLYQEKLRKGYKEAGNSREYTREETAVKPTDNKEAIANDFKQLIKHGHVEALLPFLQQHAKGHMEVLKKEVRKAKRYWMTYTDLSMDAEFNPKLKSKWGIRGNEQQQYLIKLSALALFRLGDTSSWPEILDVLNQAQDPPVQAVLQWAKPNWLADYMLQHQAKDEWFRLDYQVLRYLEAQGYMPFTPEVYARAISKFVSWGDPQENQRLLEYITQDDLAYSRDVPLVFAYETNIQNVQVRWTLQGKENVLFWDDIFDTMLEKGRIEKSYILQQSLQVQTKNWNTNLRSYFRKLIGRLHLDETQILQHQTEFFPLLHAELSTVVHFVIDTLKPYFKASGFDRAAFFTWAEPVFMRSDLKGGIKTLLIQMDKLVKEFPELLPLMQERVSDVFMLGDLPLQERAAKFLLKHSKGNLPHLQEKLQAYAPEMLGSIARDLAPLMGEIGLSEEEVRAALLEDAQVYVHQTQVPLDIDEGQKIQYPQDWNALLFQVGKTIQSDNPIDGEIVLNAWMCQRSLFPADMEEQMKPYLKQIQSDNRESAWHMCFTTIFYDLVSRPGAISQNNFSEYQESRTVSAFADLLSLVQKRIQQGISLPLLCLPTHAPVWVAPETLIERIIAYQTQGQALDALDFAIAISRMPRRGVEAAKNKLEQIQDADCRNLLTYALGLSDAIQLKKSSWVETLGAKLGKGMLPKDWNALWLLLARTHNPGAKLEAGDLQALPFAQNPYRPEIILKPSYYRQYDYEKKKYEQVYEGDRLDPEFPKEQEVPAGFLYAKDIYQRSSSKRFVYYIHAIDVAYMYSVMPQHAEPLAYYLNAVFNHAPDLGGHRSGYLLQQMLYDFYRMDPASTLYLACSLYNESKEVRAMAGEVLMQTIDTHRLPAGDLGKQVGLLLAHHYAPAKRCIEVLESIRDVSYTHNDALLQLLEALLETIELNDKMPNNFKKLLELYYDLKLKQARELSPNLKTALENLSRFKALQSIIRKILNA